MSNLVPAVYKFVGTATPASASMFDVLAAAFTICGPAKVLYNDGSTRTPGSGSAWTWSTDTSDANTGVIHGIPPFANTLTIKAILAGSSAAAAPSMRTPDTWATNIILASINKHSGAYLDWENAAPFTAGEWFGYWKTSTAAAITKVWYYEGIDCCSFAFETATGTTSQCILGTTGDPQGHSAETDGRRYGVITSGTTVISSGQNATATEFPGHGVGANGPHHGVFNVGAVTTIQTCTKNFITNVSTTTSLTYGDNTPVNAPVSFYDTVTSRMIGIGRSFGYISDLAAQQAIAVAAVDVAWAMGNSTAAAADAVALLKG